MNVHKSLLCGLLLLALGGDAFAAAKELVVYSARKEHLIKNVFEKYTAETGVKIKYTTNKAGALLTQIKNEGKSSPADVFMTVDAGYLWHAANEGVLAPANSKVLNDNIPEHLRDPQGRWFGLSVRARTIVYNTSKPKNILRQLSTYEDLADPKWKGRLCLRTSKKVYNQSLVAMLMVQYGEKETEKIVSQWVNNLATDVFPNDTKVIKAVASGQCDVGIVNTYYFGRLKEKEPDLKIGLFWPNQKNDGGVHVNVSGAGVVKTSMRQAEAVKFLEWLSSDKTQKIFAEVNHEYPAKTGVPISKIVASWGTFTPSRINLAKAGQNQAAAIKLMDRAKYR